LSKVTICIDDLCFEAIMGLLEKERTTPQKICVNAKITYDYSEKKFIDYAVLSELIRESIKKEKFYTIEETLEYLCKKLQKEFKNIEKINLKISKPDILENRVVGVKKKLKLKNSK
jgi:dihydroneopterin aldolase